ncbi:MAG: hypothetical protein JST80_01645 [Bdellovibrionales bacterium]|nr:hypothetical protein [Bdellovibrionales bacterium]
MKFKTLSLVAGMAFIAGVTLVGCGGSNNNNGACPAGQSMVNNTCQVNYNGYATGYNQCTVGQVSTQYGCLNPVTDNRCGQAPAGQAYGLYNGSTCALGTVSTGYPNTGYPNGGQCAPGSVMTQMNCLPINPQACFGSYNYGYMNGYCYPAQTGYNTGYPYGTGGNGGFYYYYIH